MRKTVLLIFILFFSLTFITPLTHAEEPVKIPWSTEGKSFLTTLKDKPIAVLLVTFDSLYTIRQREKMLFSQPQFSKLVNHFHWVKLWGAFGYGKQFKCTGLNLIVFKDEKTELDRYDLLRTQDSAVMTGLAKIAGVTLEDVKDSDFTGHIKGVATYLQQLDASEKAMDLQKAKEILAEYEQNYPTDVYLPHARNLVRKIENYEKHNERIGALPPVSKNVYIAPDIPTYLSLIGNWSEKEIFPILLWDDYLTPLFIERFKPDEVFFAPSVAQNAPITEKQIWASAAASLSDSRAADFSGATGAAYESARKRLQNHTLGIVFADLNSTGIPAALMLAAAHRQGLLLGNISVANPAKTISEEEFFAYKKKVQELLENSDWEYKRLFDDVDYFTFACDFPGSVSLFSRYDKSAYAMIDAIFRNSDDTRWGFGGNLLGDEAQKLYQANCSIFLEAKDSFFFDRYGNSGGFADYKADGAAEQMEGKGFKVELIQEKATIETWRYRHAKRNESDIVFVNSSGGAKNWSTRKGGGTTDDIPLTTPAAVHFTHSGSAGNPYSNDTIAGRWLKNGAFIYSGSHREPLLSAFQPVNSSVKELLEGSCYGFALHRRMGEVFCTPWKLMYFGDPLYSITAKREYIKGTAVIESKYSGKNALAAAMKSKPTRIDKRIAAYTEALKISTVCGETADIEKIFGDALDYISKKKNKVTPELVAGFLECCSSLARVRQNLELAQKVMGLAVYLKCPAKVISDNLMDLSIQKLNKLSSELNEKKLEKASVPEVLLAEFKAIAFCETTKDKATYYCTRISSLLTASGNKDKLSEIKKALQKETPEKSELGKALKAMK